jgi:hypothetical protein
MKITIESNAISKIEPTKVNDSSVMEASIHIHAEGAAEYGKNAEAAILGILMNAFMAAADKFVNSHSCKSCTTFVMYNSMLRHMQTIQRETMKHIGEEELLDATQS